MTTVESFVADLATYSFANVFNPYADSCATHDGPDAPAIRRQNLTCVIEAALSIGTDSIWFGRDLGYRGGRRTGLALTDEAHLPMLRTAFRDADVRQATMTAPVAERTAQEIWKMIGLLPQPPFLWNAFPFHPHEPGEPMTNRRHTAGEAKIAEDILDTLLSWFKPSRIVALGKDAERALERMGRKSVAIRHPSYGGQADFIAGVRKLYGLSAKGGAARRP
jgi:hypothetical protein